MKTILSIGAVAILFGTPATFAQDARATQAESQSSAQSSATTEQQSNTSTKPLDETTHAEAYYDFLMGHLDELKYESSEAEADADQSIEEYKKALEIEPDSPVVLERLAEIYAKSQHTRDAVIQAKAALKLDPHNVDAHRLLARIYIRSLGDLSTGDVQQENIGKAIEQFQAILSEDPNDTYSALWLARLYRFENHHDDAEKVLRGILKHDPDSGPALEQLSQLLVDEGRSQDAIALLTQAAGDSSSPDDYALLGDAYAQEKDYAKAEDAYRKSVDEDPDDAGHLHQLAQLLLTEEKYPDALELFKKLTTMEPDSFENYVRISQLYRRMGKFDDAESNLLRAKQLAPGNLEILYNEALLYEDQERFGDAVKVLSDAIAGIKGQSSSNENNPNALAILYEQLGHAYREEQNYPAAIESYQEMRKLGPEAAQRAQMLLIETYRDSRDIGHAIDETKKALADSPKDQQLTITLAMLYGENAQTDEATKLLQGLMQGNDNNQEILLDLAQVQEQGKHYTDAEQSAVKAEQLSQAGSDKEAAWFMLGAIYERQKKYDQAEQQFRKVLQENPNDAPVLNYYGYMLADRGVRLEEATNLIQRAVRQEPNNGAYLDSLGWAYYKASKLAEAEEYLRKATERDAHDPTILGHLADVYLKMGQTDRAVTLMEKARTEWQRAVPSDYDPDKVGDLDAQLKSLKKRLAQKSTTETGKSQ
ncbi:MAG TPA: tetratricopeptide repeat protein [Candidatus Acidoferrales bacterium]|nr:tetratricopeptide repeat protein [Candidatus Acidoferrales bacterium]